MRYLTLSRKRDGISLVEVLITLVIFTIGILTIIRVFPTGLGIIRNSQNYTIADRLAQAELDRLRNNAANLPAGILSVLQQTGIFVDTDPDELYKKLLDIAGTQYEDYIGLNKFRYIHEEAVVIPPPTKNYWDVSDPASGCMYITQFGPISWEDDSSIKIYSGPMRRQPFPADTGYLDLPTPSDYAIDYWGPAIYVRAVSYERSYTLNYSYWEEEASQYRLVSRVGVELTVPEASSEELSIGYQKIEEIPDHPSGSVIQYGSDSLHRAFTKLNEEDEWDASNAYQYKVKNATIGILAFNPAGYKKEEVTSRGRELLTAYINYHLLDWHILREERRVPERATSSDDPRLSVKLTLGGIKQKGFSIADDGTRYTGLADGIPYNVLAVDTTDWTVYDEEDSAFTVDYRNGWLKFNPSHAGRTFRIYYRATGNWGVQVYKSFNEFQPSYVYPTESTPLNYNQYYVDAQTVPVGDPPVDETRVKIYFPECYTGRSVSVDCVYRLTTDSANSPDRFIAGEVFQIETDAATLLPAIDLTSSLTSKRGHTADEIVFKGVSRVRGVTVGVKVLRIDIGAARAGGRWKVTDLQTYLTHRM